MASLTVWKVREGFLEEGAPAMKLERQVGVGFMKRGFILHRGTQRKPRRIKVRSLEDAVISGLA